MSFPKLIECEKHGYKGFAGCPTCEAVNSELAQAAGSPRPQGHWPGDDITLLRNALERAIVGLTHLAPHYDPEEEDTEIADIFVTNGDCRRAWEALSTVRLALDETKDYAENVRVSDRPE